MRVVEPILEAKNIVHTYISKNDKLVKAINGISLDVFKNEFVAVVGPSGGGKSTLLNILAGILEPTSGEIRINGAPVNYKNNSIGYISQSDTLMPWRTILDNISIGLEIQGVSKKKRYEKSKDLMCRNGLEGFEDKYPKELSGGMAKRAIILRALVVNPSVIFMDEPFGSLDIFTKEKLQNEVLTIFEKNQTTVVYVTHDIREAILLSDRVISLSNRPAKIKDIYNIPLDRPRKDSDLLNNYKVIQLESKIRESIESEFRKEDKKEVINV